MQIAVMCFAAALRVVCLTSCQRDTRSDPGAAAQEPSPPPPRPAIPERPGRTLVDAKSLKLQELVEDADRIFRGRVVRINPKSVSIEQGGDKAEAQVREVIIAVEEGFKNAKAGEQITVRQLVSVSAPLEADEEVFWFLAKDSELGLTQPLGVFSGDFRIRGDSEAGKVVNNLRGNAGLWEGSLWTGDGFNRNEVLETAKTLKFSAARVARMESQATREPDNRPLSLDLLVAATRSQVKPQ